MPSKPGYLARAMLVKETTFGVPLVAPTSADRFEIVLRDRALAQVMEMPQVVVRRTAGGGNRPGGQVAGRVRMPLSIVTYLYSSQAPTLVPAAFSPVIPGGGNRLVLPSFTLHSYDGETFRKFPGVRFDVGEVMSQAGDDYVMITLTGEALKEDTSEAWDEDIFGGAYAEPAGFCYVHQHSSGEVEVNNTDLDSRSVRIRTTNVNDKRHMGGRYISRNGYNGRDITAGLTIYSDNATYQDLFIDQTPADLEIGWASGANHVRFALNNYSYLTSYERSTTIAADVDETHAWLAHEGEGDGTGALALTVA